MVCLVRSKKFIIAFLFAALAALPFAPSVEASGIKKDKFLHFGCSAFIEVALAEIPPFKKWTPLERMIFNVAVFGAGKELYDRAHGGKFDWGDMAADAVGAGFGEISVRYIGNQW